MEEYEGILYEEYEDTMDGLYAWKLYIEIHQVSLPFMCVYIWVIASRIRDNTHYQIISGGKM